MKGQPVTLTVSHTAGIMAGDVILVGSMRGASRFTIIELKSETELLIKRASRWEILRSWLRSKWYTTKWKAGHWWNCLFEADEAELQ